MTGWFLDAEVSWLVENYYQEFLAIDRHGQAEYKGQNMSSLQAFLRRVTDEFGTEFPYRHYQTPVNKIPEELWPQQIKSSSAWGQLPEVSNKSRLSISHPKIKPGVETHEGKESKEVTSESGAMDESQDESEEESGGESKDEDATAQWTDVEPESKAILQDAAMRDERFEGSASPTNASANNPWDDYQPSDEQTCGWNVVLEYLDVLKTSSWAECDADDLAQRKRLLPMMLKSILELINYGTGCEVYAACAVALSKTHFSFDTVTPRCNSFVYSSAAEKAREMFTSYVALYVDRMAAQNYDMVSPEALPKDVHILRSPFTMTAEETRQWTLHICDHEEEHAPRFRFELPCPNHPIGNSIAQRAPAAILGYGPDALAYARQVYSHSEDIRTPRGDELPYFSVAEPAYHLLVDSDHTALITGVQESPECVKMLMSLRDFDDAFPVQANFGVWQQQSALIPHLKSEAPSLNASIDHLVADGGWLPPEFYDITHPDHFAKGLAQTLAWCHPRTITHARTVTLMGGPMGVKWLVLMLCHVQFNAISLKTNWQDAVAYYGDLALNGKVAFLDRDLDQLRGAIEALTSALIESTAILWSSADQRQVLTATERVDTLAHQAHAHFPRSSDGFTLHVTVDECEAWDAAVNALENQAMVLDEQEPYKSDNKMAKAIPAIGKGKKPDISGSSATRGATVNDGEQSVRKRKAKRRVSFSPDDTRHKGVCQ
ncbi:hypothetical protein BN14_06687 [Rhizoctonia solani AG-1 IB]|uniref:Uncharacterized protein n=1 Tax=Thanatephorus cucumeris (strain AG1-IB / isolate 7/3/14) TaxID=1108050 RepID=M5BZM8_THACB|nr:hypothetical protein BN14_06687 [Rhizoctonia solani AG-1 IB]